MSTSSGRKAGQAYIDMIKQYNKRVPTKSEVYTHLNRNLSPKTRYTPEGFNRLWTWLKK